MTDLLSQVVIALIKAHKDFDLLVVPNEGHWECDAVTSEKNPDNLRRAPGIFRPPRPRCKF